MIETSNLRTNIIYLRILGLVYSYKIHSILSCGLIYTAVCHYFFQIAFESDEMTRLGIVENIHWVILFSTEGFCVLQFFFNSDKYLELRYAVRTGSYMLGELDEEQIQIRNKTNNQIIRISNIYTTLGLTAALVQFLRKTIKLFIWKQREKPWEFFFNGYVPWDFDSIDYNWAICAYCVVMFLQLLAGFQIAFCMSTCITVFTALAGHLWAQLKILQVAIKNVNVNKEGGEETDEDVIYQRLTKCVKLHLIVIQYYEKFQKSISIFLLATSVTTGLLICTMGYLMTDPDTNLVSNISFLIVFIPECCFSIFYCWFGQKIYDQSENIKWTVYDTIWYKQSCKVRKAWLMIMIRCRKPMTLTGGGIQTFSMKGLTEIMTTAYSYLNMLVATR